MVSFPSGYPTLHSPTPRVLVATEKDKKIGELQATNFSSVANSFRPVLISSGLYGGEEVEEMVAGGQEELASNKVKQYSPG